jgi:hypothetical protein
MPWKTVLSKGHLMGFVRNAADSAVFDGATLTLTGPVNRTLLCDGTGFYGSVDLPVGSYTLTISLPGYGSQVRPVTISGASVRQESFRLGPPVLALRTFNYDAATRRATLTWSSEAGQTFRVEYSEDLAAWLPFTVGLPATGLTTAYLTPAAPAGTIQRWFRIRRE